MGSSEIIFEFILLGDRRNIRECLKRDPSAVKAKLGIFGVLNFAVLNTNSTEVVAELLEHGAAIDETNLGTPLRTAACYGKTDIVRYLLSKGARDDVQERDGYSPLLGAARDGHAEVCKVLVEHGSDVNQQHPLTKDSALSYAAAGGHHETLLMLLSLGAWVDSQTYTGFTPLAAACQNGHLTSVVSLLQAGASTKLSDTRGAPPIHKAAGKDRVAIVMTLLEHGCNKEQVIRRLSKML